MEHKCYATLKQRLEKEGQNGLQGPLKNIKQTVRGRPADFQEGRKPNQKSETEPESPKTEPGTVYKETGETRTEETETAVCKKVVPLHRPEVGQIKSCRSLSATIWKLSARCTNERGFRAWASQGL